MVATIEIGTGRIKECVKCGCRLPTFMFHKQKLGKFGVRSKCKSCRNVDYIDNREDILIDRREYYISNKDNILEYHYRYRIAAKEDIKKYRLDNKDAIVITKRIYNRSARGKSVNRKSDKRKRARCNNWGTSEPINEYFEGSHEHHLHLRDTTTTVYLPAELHNSIRHSSTTGKGITGMAILAALHLASEHMENI